MKAYVLILHSKDLYSHSIPKKYSFSKPKLEADAIRYNNRIAEYNKILDSFPDEHDGEEWEDVEDLDYAEVKEIEISD
jgi:hypothetical protein